MRAWTTYRSAAAPAALAALLGAVLALTGCSTPSSPSAPAAAPTAEPSASAAPAVRLKAPAKLHGLPRSTSAKWLKAPKGMEWFLKGKVLSPTSSAVATYRDPDGVSDTVELSAVAGRVSHPTSTLRLLTMADVHDLDEVRPTDVGVPGGLAMCGLSDELRPAVVTICNWAEPGSVGWVRITSMEDRRDWFTGLRAELTAG